MDWRPSVAHDANRRDRLAVMLTGGGARAAYQVGLLVGIAEHFPELEFQVITGVSAGAINAIFLAANEGSLPQRVEQLANVWRGLECPDIFRPNYKALIPFGSAIRSLFPKRFKARPHGLFDASPLAQLLRRQFHCNAPNQPIAVIRHNLEPV